VIDEFAGQWIALLPLAAPSPLGLLLAFALFRLFDIAKPGPIDAAQRLPGATGVMADDILAGLAAAAIVWAARTWWPDLF
jgi:phosphatidylglycerophosphatase A